MILKISYHNREEYPVEFDLVYPLVYSRKGKAVDMLIKQDLLKILTIFCLPKWVSKLEVVVIIR